MRYLMSLSIVCSIVTYAPILFLKFIFWYDRIKYKLGLDINKLQVYILQFRKNVD